MKVPIGCPEGEYRAAMRIWCRKAKGWCGNQFFKRCKGWWALNERAAACPLRRRP